MFSIFVYVTHIPISIKGLWMNGRILSANEVVGWDFSSFSDYF